MKFGACWFRCERLALSLLASASAVLSTISVMPTLRAASLACFGPAMQPTLADRRSYETRRIGLATGGSCYVD